MSLFSTPKDHFQLAAVLTSLGSKLFSRYEQKGSVDDLETAVSNLQQALAATPEDHPERAGRLGGLGSALTSRYDHTKDKNDLKAAISYTEQAIYAMPEGRPERAGWVNNLGSALSSRYELTGDINDLETAISYTEQAISGTPEDHPEWAKWLYNLGNRLMSRYDRTGNLADLGGAITHAEKALSSMPEDHPKRLDMVKDLGHRLSSRYKRKGNSNDLEGAIANIEKTLFSTSEDHPDRAGWLSDLGSLLSSRHERTGSTNDVDAAVSNIKQALSTMPAGHERPSTIEILGSALWIRHERTGKMDDLETAILCSEQALSAVPEDHPDRGKWLNNFSNKLFSRYEQSGNMDDLDAPIQNLNQAISATSEEGSYRREMLANLGRKLASRYERTGDVADLEAGISNAQQAVSLIAKDHPDWSGSLSNLSIMLSHRFRLTGDVEDLDNALSGFETAARCSSEIPLYRVYAARRALRILQALNMWERGCQLSQEAVDLLPEVCSRYLNRQDQQYAITQTSGLAADACSLSLRAGHVEQALRQVEFGRGLILGYLIDSRSDISVLRQDHQDLADELEGLRLLTSRPFSDKEAPSIRERLIRDHRIRKKDGYDRFLLQPKLDELVQGAEEGPIIIVNVTDISSDAIIVSRIGVRAIELPEMTSYKTSFLAQDLRRYRDVETRGYYGRDIESDTHATALYSSKFLSWLWTSCVAPVLDELAKLPEFTDSTQVPRVWWIGTGVASPLPFHAAREYPTSLQEDALNRMISSYTPTIKLLIHARSCAARLNDRRDTKAAVLVVAMPETPGQMSLPGVAEESLAIQQALGDIFTVKALEQPSVSQVLERMANSDIVRFACHGLSDHTDPSNSHLLLQSMTLPEMSDASELSEPPGSSDSFVGRLTVQDISENQALGKAQIAYLSACSTAEVKAGQFAEEALHIVSAFQVAGFGHVVGSLWSADDDTCVQMARFFYEYLASNGYSSTITNRMVAEALRDATLRIRRDRDARLWAPYIHSGA